MLFDVTEAEAQLIVNALGYMQVACPMLMRKLASQHEAQLKAGNLTQAAPDNGEVKSQDGLAEAH
jgi:hypothetical protein